MQIESVGVSSNDTDGTGSSDMDELLKQINEEGSEEGMSTNRYSGDKWNMTIPITVSSVSAIASVH
jgi:hypothetical protein